MRIEEMRSGTAHLKKRPAEKPANDRFEYRPLPDAVSEPEDVECGLSYPEWSIVSFDRVEARSLTYREASDLMRELYQADVRGLCIVTDAVAWKA